MCSGCAYRPDWAAVRVLHVIDSLGRGGAERQLVHLIGALADEVEHRVVTLMDDMELVEPLARAGVPVKSLGLSRFWDWPKAVRPLRSVIRSWQPDVVHTRLAASDMAGRMAALRRTPVVSSIESSIYDPAVRAQDALEGRVWKRNIIRWQDILTAKLSGTTYAACAPSVAKSAAPALHVSPARMRVTTNSILVPGIAPPAPRPVRAGEPITLMIVGKLSPPKGHEYLLRAMPMVAQRHPLSRLVVVGDGPLRGELVGLANGLGIQDRIDWLGNRDDVSDLLPTAHVVVLPSVREGLSLVVLEAMASGAAVVASDIPAMRDAIVPGKSGVLVPPRDSKALAAAISEVLGKDELRRQLGREAWRRARSEFDIVEGAQRVRRLYEELAQA